jgi:hypothetical protein
MNVADANRDAHSTTPTTTTNAALSLIISPPLAWSYPRRREDR